MRSQNDRSRNESVNAGNFAHVPTEKLTCKTRWAMFELHLHSGECPQHFVVLNGHKTVRQFRIVWPAVCQLVDGDESRSRG